MCVRLFAFCGKCDTLICKEIFSKPSKLWEYYNKIAKDVVKYMKEHRFREYVYWGVTAVAVIVSCILVTLVFVRWQTVCQAVRKVNIILAPITYGAILAYLLSPVYNRLRSWLLKLLGSLRSGAYARLYGTSPRLSEP